MPRAFLARLRRHSMLPSSLAGALRPSTTLTQPLTPSMTTFRSRTPRQTIFWPPRLLLTTLHRCPFPRQRTHPSAGARQSAGAPPTHRAAGAAGAIMTFPSRHRRRLRGAPAAPASTLPPPFPAAPPTPPLTFPHRPPRSRGIPLLRVAATRARQTHGPSSARALSRRPPTLRLRAGARDTLSTSSSPSNIGRERGRAGRGQVR
mmetsp:Transcript_18348/g.45021  ORF Transcript_18348/g.45021 Transcript_18348/m.45021 type:complete len:204 (+) Transcript_18348:770-1381(+)